MSKLGSFMWSIADQLRGPYKPWQYGDVILPMTILRRLDCILEGSSEQVRALAASQPNEKLLEFEVRKRLGLHFFNTSPWDFKKLLSDPDGLRANLIDYTHRFSDSIDVFERFKFDEVIAGLDESNRLFLVVSKFAEVDLHPDAVSNAEMGDAFEYLIRKFAEASNETAGEHFTPRDAIRLMVDLLFTEDHDGLSKPGAVRTVYDPTAGTGGMLSVAEERLLEMNPSARLTLFGQEHNPQSYAICKSDMIAKGQDPSNIQLADTLADDRFANRTFDYCLSNPPYGVDWKASADAVKAERAATGKAGRFGPGLPKISDGQMLFLTHLAHKLRPIADGGGRGAIVLNGSPLFNGGAESGESEIRRWLLEQDLVDAIIALPTNMFFNTGISTYVWLLDNTKQPKRVGKVQLIDATSFFTKMRKSLGDKTREIGEEDRQRILELYEAFEDSEHAKIFATHAFGYWSITIERPLRLNFACTPERVEKALEAKALQSLDQATLRAALSGVGETLYRNRDEFLDVLDTSLKAHGLKLGAAARKALWAGLGERDEAADICTDRKGAPEPDPALRDTENVPFGASGPDERDATIAAYFEQEVLPHVPDAWIDYPKTKVGYEIPLTRHFYKYEPPRPLEEIDADLNQLVGEIMELLQEIER